MRQLLWKEWRKTRALILLFVGMNVIAILFQFQNIPAWFIYAATSLFLSVLVPAIVFIGDRENNSEKFTCALPVSRQYMWSIKMIYIFIVWLSFHLPTSPKNRDRIFHQ